MGKTAESYRMAIEDEIRRWNGFAKALRKEDREAFDILMGACRNYTSDKNNLTQPLLFEPMMISMLISQQIRLKRIEKELDDLKQKQYSGCQLR